MGDRGRGQGRGRGRGQVPNQTIKNLERAATDIQNMLLKMNTDEKGSGSGGNKRRGGGSRGSKSLMDLSGQGGQQHGYQSPPNQPINHPGPPNQGYHHYGPPGQAPPYQPPPGQRHYHQGPPGRGHYHQGPPGQGHHHQGPPGQGHYYQGPPGQEYYHPRSYSEGPTNHYPPAPPSYEESVGHYDSRPQPLMQDKYKMKGKAPTREVSKSAHAQELVKALAMFEGQMADSEVISRQIESSVEEVEKAVRQRKDLFAYIQDGNKMMVELVPNIKLCTYYLSENGCTARGSCQALHLCRNFILTRCDLGSSCTFGHKFDTNHNNSILSKLYLDLIKTHNLLLIIKKMCRGNAPPRVCGYYSTKDGCRKKDNCKFLHICKDYVMNDGKCPAKNCPFNHQLTNKQCKTVLAQHGMSTNESIRDILLKVKQVLERGGGRHSSPAPKQDKKKEEQEESEDSQDSSDSDSCQEDTAHASVKKKTKKTHGKAKEKGSKSKGKKATIKSTDFCGDVEIPEICIYSINNKCMNEKKGCKYLHAKSLFHWQVEKDKKWYNFRIFQSKALESAYRDVSQNSITMPNIDTTKLVTEDKNILEILGPNTWTANFRDMCISDPAGKQLNIRRVSTPSSALSGLPQATVYDWYFEDEQGKWIRYGNVNSSGKQDFVCNITSEDIEKQYVTDASTTMLISNNHFKYKIDFAIMTQTNLSSSKVREIRRRPIRLAYQKTGTTTAAPTFATSASRDSSSLPAYWQPMKSQEPYKLVTLDPNSTEFQDVCKSIKLMIPTAKICEVRRLQNEYLWRLFQYKKTDLANRYDELTMNVQKLYHGTDPDFINAICKENIDGRRYANTKDKYGKGTYFSNSSAVARTYCTPDTQGHLFMILADVIIGYVTVGNKNLNKPPLNSLIDKPYDTTVDSMTAPTVFVKYYKEEYYPEYIIEFIADGDGKTVSTWHTATGLVNAVAAAWYGTNDK